MDNDNYIAFMALHTHPIVERLAEMRKISIREALELFYMSNFYRLYEREATKLWHFSTITLSEMLNQDLSDGKIEFPVEG